VEADDVIGTLALRGADGGFEVLISTGDKDMAQLVGPRITLVNTMSNTRLDRAGVKAEVRRVSRADRRLSRAGGRQLRQHSGRHRRRTEDRGQVAQPIPDAGRAHRGRRGNRRQGRRESAQRAAGARAVAQARDARYARLALELSPEDLTPGAPDHTRLRELYTRLELRALLKSLESTLPPAGPRGVAVVETEVSSGAVDVTSASGTAFSALEPPQPRHYTKVLTRDALDAWIEKLAAAPLCASEPRPTGPTEFAAGWWVCRLRSRRARPPTCRSATIIREHPSSSIGNARWQALKPLLENEALAKLGHQLKLDAHILASHGIALRGQTHDSMLESYVLDSVATGHDMDSIAEKYLRLKTVRLEDIAGKGAKQLPLGQVDVDRAAEYGAEHADVTLRLHQAIWPQIEAVPTLKNLYETIEQPLVPVLYRMEHAGVLVDRALLRAQSTELAARMLELQAQAHSTAGSVFNLDSPKQLQEMLFGKLGLPVIRKTPTGQPSTAEDVLEELAASYELPRLILEYRGLTKLKSTYTDKLPGQVDERRGASIRPISKASRQRDVSPRRIRTCRTSRFARPKGGAYGKRSWRRPATAWSPRIIRKSNCASWRISPAMRAWWRHSPRIATCTRPPRPRCSASRSRR
jgi:DNA polymerase-1